MGILCSDSREVEGDDSKEKLISERSVNHVLTDGVLSLDRIPELSGFATKSEEKVCSESNRNGTLQAMIHKQELEIARLTKLWKKSRESEMKSEPEVRSAQTKKRTDLRIRSPWTKKQADVEIKSEPDLRSPKTEKQSKEVDAEKDLEEPDLKSALKSRGSEMVLGEQNLDQHESSSSTNSSANGPQSVIILEANSISDLIDEDGYVKLQDFKGTNKVKLQPHHHRAESLPDIRTRAKVWKNRSWAGSDESIFAQKLTDIETQIVSTTGEISKMRRRSIDILTGRLDGTDWGQVEKTINDLAAKKDNLEKERLEAYMNLQSKLMVPAGSGDMEFEQIEMDDHVLVSNLQSPMNTKNSNDPQDEILVKTRERCASPMRENVFNANKGMLTSPRDSEEVVSDLSES